MAARRIIDSVETHYTINLYKGITYSKTFQYKGADGNPIDISTKYFSIKFKDVFPAQLDLFTNAGASVLGSTFTVIDAPNGKFRLQLSDEETATAGTGSGKWWIEVYDGSDINLLWLDSVNVVEL